MIAESQSPVQRNALASAIVTSGLAALLALAAPHAVAQGNSWTSAPIVSAVRDATARYRNPAAAIADGYVADPFCVSGSTGGGMGIHFVNAGLLDDTVDVNTPEVLVYEPLPSGKHRLVAAEYIAFADPPLALEGHLLNLAGAPNRYGIPSPFLELHVWAWKQNPSGTFADFNPNVSCDAQQPAP